MPARSFDIVRTGISAPLTLLVVISLSSCGFWPEELKPLAESISQQVGGEAMAWRVGKDVVVINVANSPLYQEPLEELQSVAADIAAQAVAFASVPITSVAVTFHENEISDVPDEMREFIFVTIEGQLTLAPDLDI